MSIYTKKGDQGFTELIGGKRLSKCSLRVNTYGSVDELNSILGVIISKITDEKAKAHLQTIQHQLFVIGTILADPDFKHPAGLNVEKDSISKLESKIDEWDKQLPQLSNLVIPGGSVLAAEVHYARSICRRVERNLVALAEKEKVPENLVVYLNRLSDFLFTLARFTNLKADISETVWDPKAI